MKKKQRSKEIDEARKLIELRLKKPTPPIDRKVYVNKSTLGEEWEASLDVLADLDIYD